jgi:hypothetical protein
VLSHRRFAARAATRLRMMQVIVRRGEWAAREAPGPSERVPFCRLFVQPTRSKFRDIVQVAGRSVVPCGPRVLAPPGRRRTVAIAW